LEIFELVGYIAASKRLSIRCRGKLAVAFKVSIEGPGRRLRSSGRSCFGMQERQVRDRGGLLWDRVSRVGGCGNRNIASVRLGGTCRRHSSNNWSGEYIVVVVVWPFKARLGRY
jgi:hypothetical protein